MISADQLHTLIQDGGSVVGDNEDKIGKVGQVFLDDDTSTPEWVTVKTGLFGSGESFVPLAGATSDGKEIRVPFAKDTVKDAPRVDGADGHLSAQEEAELYRYYGMETPEPQSREHAGREDVAGRDTSGPTTDTAMTRSEEQLTVDTETVAAGKARLRKYVVTENVTQTVPVSHEEVRIEREPITDANRDQAMAGGGITSEEHEVTLHAEQPVVAKETVPVERVRMGTETVAGEQTVSDEVRKEQIETDADVVDIPDERATAEPGSR